MCSTPVQDAHSCAAVIETSRQRFFATLQENHNWNMQCENAAAAYAHALAMAGHAPRSIVAELMAAGVSKAGAKELARQTTVAPIVPLAGTPRVILLIFGWLLRLLAILAGIIALVAALVWAYEFISPSPFVGSRPPIRYIIFGLLLWILIATALEAVARTILRFGIARG